ncbi:MAG: IscS subfamily cysteine desulfurase [Candidatus Marinimicrobia bacterium]|nr:IscS subfamily cysteine desulfurase [Candidatus Neomarinimicrobiota bacterium]
MQRNHIYLDYQATTPVDPRVMEVMLPYFTEKFGNPASKSHVYGWAAREAVEAARSQVAALIGATPREIIFTSGATEAINLALKGVAGMYASKGRHIITVATEHRAVLDTCKALEQSGFKVTYLGVPENGLLDLDELRRAITGETILVSVMHANNEIGVIQPMAGIGALCREKGVFLHVDGAQSVGKIPVDVQAMRIDLLALSAHKLYGPMGIGALYVRRRNPQVRLKAQIHGGGHERGLRSGSLPTPLIVGLGAACQILIDELHAEGQRIQILRDRLWSGIRSRLDQVQLNGDPHHRLPGNVNVSFGGVDGNTLLASLANIAVSSGSACTSESTEPSHVLRALGLDDALARASIRFGIGRFTTEAEIDAVVNTVVENVERLRATAPH